MRILIIKLSSIGDLIHCVPAYRQLKKHLPHAKIDWLVYKNLSSCLENFVEQDNRIELEDKNFFTLIKKAQSLKSQYDYVIDLQGLFKTALLAKIINAKSSYGFNFPRESWAKYFYKKSFCDFVSLNSKKHIIEQNLELIESFLEQVLHIKANTEIDFSFASPIEPKKQETEKKQLCIIPATTWESKHWHINNWVELLKRIDCSQYEIYATGSPANSKYLNSIRELSATPLKIIDNKKLPELFDFYGQMDTIIGVDTGPLHIAAASLFAKKDQKKIIGIYGPTSASRSGPYGFSALSADEILAKQASNKKTLSADENSIDSISVDMVLESASLVL